MFTRFFYSLFLCLLLPLALWAAEPKTTVIHAEAPKGNWAGWGDSSSPAADISRPATPGFELKKVGPNEARIFSGRVEGRRDGEKLEVGLVSLEGIHWIAEDTYQWQAVGEDGTFSIQPGNYPNGRKAICVRGPEAPWTFFPYDFAAGEAASNIVITIPERKVITITAGGSEEERLKWFGVEPFIDGAVNHLGASLRRQRLGYHNGGDAAEVRLVLAAAPIPVFIHAPGKAGFYKVIDPTTADHFHFVLESAGQMEITVLSNGAPMPNEHVDWINPAAPLSIGRGTTDAEGKLTAKNLVPGTFIVSAARVSQKVVVGDKEPVKVLFQTK